MRMYRLGEGANAEGWPFLLARHAYLADGTPLTGCDEDGRIVPSREALGAVEKICSGGCLTLAARRSGIEALARALDKGDLVRAPILLLQLQIDPNPPLAKFNPWHKPPGPGGGQFSSGSAAGDSPDPSGFHTVASDLHVGYNSTYEPGKYGADIDAAHNLVMAVVGKAILEVGSLNYRPGMPGYGEALHKAVELEMMKYLYLGFHSEEPYLLGVPVFVKLPGSSVPDIVFGSLRDPRIVWEIKTGSAAMNIDSKETVWQKVKTLLNMPGNPVYEYIQVYEK